MTWWVSIHTVQIHTHTHTHKVHLKWSVSWSHERVFCTKQLQHDFEQLWTWTSGGWDVGSTAMAHRAAALPLPDIRGEVEAVLKYLSSCGRNDMLMRRCGGEGANRPAGYAGQLTQPRCFVAVTSHWGSFCETRSWIMFPFFLVSHTLLLKAMKVDLLNSAG